MDVVQLSQRKMSRGWEMAQGARAGPNPESTILQKPQGMQLYHLSPAK